jgi:hypothetical protein
MAVLLEVRSTNAAHQPGSVSYYAAFIVDTDDKVQGELVHKGRAVFQGCSEIGTISERYLVLLVKLGDIRELAS